MKNFLDKNEKEILRLQHRKEKNKRICDRIKAVLMADDGWSNRAIAEVLLLDEETIARHIKEYQTKQKLNNEGGGSVSLLSKVQTEELVKHLEENTYVKVKEICFYIEKKYGISYSAQGMTHWLHRNKFSYKKAKGTPIKANAEKQKEFIKAYEELKAKISEDEVIEFGDGVHPSMATKLSYGWILKGKEKPIPTTASRTRMNVMGSINLKTMGITVKSYETINSESMKNYLELLRSKYPKEIKIHLIIDQGPYNTSAETKLCAKELNIILHFLPPYSPNLNPIERVWKIMNEYARNNRFFSSPKDFRSAILDFFELTWPKISLKMHSRVNDNFQIINSLFSG